MRLRSTSARASSNSTSMRVAPAATSSSTKNALPSERRRIRSSASAPTRSPTSALRCSASSSRLKGECHATESGPSGLDPLSGFTR